MGHFKRLCARHQMLPACALLLLLPRWVEAQADAPSVPPLNAEQAAVWQSMQGRFDRMPKDSRYFPLTATVPQADALVEGHEKAWAKGWGAAADFDLEDPGILCKAVGIFRGPGSDVGYLMIGRPGELVMLNTGDGPIVNRRIYFNRDHLPYLQPSFFGDSIGKIKGDTLVVDTIGFNDKTWLSTQANRHSEDLHVVERFRFVEPGILEHVEVIDDPRALSSPVTLTWYYKKNPEPTVRNETVCEGTLDARRGWLKMYTRALKALREDQAAAEAKDPKQTPGGASEAKP